MEITLKTHCVECKRPCLYSRREQVFGTCNLCCALFREKMRMDVEKHHQQEVDYAYSRCGSAE